MVREYWSESQMKNLSEFNFNWLGDVDFLWRVNDNVVAYFKLKIPPRVGSFMQSIPVRVTTLWFSVCVYMSYRLFYLWTTWNYPVEFESFKNKQEFLLHQNHSLFYLPDFLSTWEYDSYQIDMQILWSEQAHRKNTRYAINWLIFFLVFMLISQ